MAAKKIKNKTALPSLQRELLVKDAPNMGRVLGLILFAIAFMLYLNTINHDYALDDVAVIQQNKFTKQGIAGIPTLLKTFYWQGYWEQNAGLYRPLSMVTFALEYEFFKDSPHVSHFFNVLLYALTVLLLFKVLRKLFEKQSIVLPFVITLLFAVHPVHTEVVANIKSRDELLCFLFFLFSLSNLLTYFKTGVNKNLFAALFCFFLSLFSKEGGLVFLGIIPLTLYFFTAADTKKILRVSGQLLAVTLVFITIHEAVLSHSPAHIPYSYHDNSLVPPPGHETPKLTQLATALLILGNYLKLLFIPHPLSYDYSYNQFPLTGMGNLFVLLSLAVHVGLLIYALKNLKQKNMYSFVILFYLLAISMVSNVFMLIGTTMADRLLYAPSLAFCIAVGWFIFHFTKSELTEKVFSSFSDFYKSYSKQLLTAFLISAAFSLKAFTRNEDWQDNFTLFTKDVKASPGSSRTHYNYGTQLMFIKAFNEKDSLKKMAVLDEVISELETAVHIDSIDPGSYLNLSTAYYQRKNYPKAIETASKAAKYNPADAKPYSTLGNAYYRIGNYDKAIESLRICISKGFGQQEAYNTIGVSYFGKKDYPQAVEAFKKSTEINPKDIVAINNLGSAYGLAGNFTMAVETFKKSYAVDSTNKQTVYYLAITYQNMKDEANAKLFGEKYQRMNGGQK